MLIAARNAMLAGGGGDLSAKSYVQDGLVAMWDGIENAGWGVHDASATTWMDLIGSADLTAKNTPTINDDSVSFDGTCCFYKTGLSISDVGTMEVCGYRDTQHIANANMICVSNWPSASQRKITYEAGWASTKVAFGITNIGRFALVDMGSGRTGSWILTTTPMQQYWDGAYVGTWSPNWSPYEVSNVAIGATSQYLDYPAKCTIYCARLYNRVLTAAEIAANYAVDKARFNLP